MKHLIRKLIKWFEAPIEFTLVLKQEEERERARRKGYEGD